MRLPNGYGGVVKLSGKRRKPFAARVTAGWKLNERTGKDVQQYQILGAILKQRQAPYKFLPNIMIIQLTYQL